MLSLNILEPVNQTNNIYNIATKIIFKINRSNRFSIFFVIKKTILIEDKVNTKYGIMSHNTLDKRIGTNLLK
jgi:hypothetical protein